MKKPATGRHAGAGFSRNDLVTSSRRFIADLPPYNQVDVPPRPAQLARARPPTTVREVFWNQFRLGYRLPAQSDVIVIAGGQR